MLWVVSPMPRLKGFVVHQPENAPLRFKFGDRRILHILKLEIFVNVGFIHKGRYGHISIALHGGMRTTRYPLSSSPVSSNRKTITYQVFQITSA